MEDGEVSTNDILNQPHDTDDDLLLETVLCDMRKSSLKFRKNLNRDRKDKLQLIQTQLNISTSSINADNCFEETKILEGELLRLNKYFLADQAAIFKNTTLLNYCKR